MPTTSLPGIGASIRIERADEGHRQVVGERLDPRQLDVVLGLDLVLGHDRAGVRPSRPWPGSRSSAASPRSARLFDSWSIAAAGRGRVGVRSRSSIGGRVQSIAWSDSSGGRRLAECPSGRRDRRSARRRDRRRCHRGRARGTPSPAPGPDRLAHPAPGRPRRRLVEDARRQPAPGAARLELRRSRARVGGRRSTPGRGAGLALDRGRGRSSAAGRAEPAGRCRDTGWRSSLELEVEREHQPDREDREADDERARARQERLEDAREEPPDPAAAALGAEEGQVEDLERPEEPDERDARSRRASRPSPSSGACPGPTRGTSRPRGAGTAAASGRSRTTARSSRATSR